ncbi:MAG: hypothetical protein Q8N02_04175 [Methylotenera sp.]|nr:hypothetical protein [Methylotenera sp.]MDO9233620.1 hypothetical protein [Methylotenera sp.]MDP2403733.1 hypothetical protein [Methylotenera sp.]MDP3094765.1 hypothetical protein [Methylotenera sp.]MDZ4224007.1 hypothetical protein [Methylotenera sp.]
MKIELIMDEAQQAFFDKLKQGNDELVVPLDKWNAYIHDNLPTELEQRLEFVISGAYVITERGMYNGFVESLKYLHYDNKRLTKQEGGFWFAIVLEPKKIMPKHDIFDASKRQPGSFRS